MSRVISAIRAAFDSPEHDTLFHRANEPAYLLVHGFLGTPAEWQAIILHLSNCNHTVLAPLLPGFGRHLAELFRTRWTDWLAALEQAWQQLRHYETRVIVGFSLGGALATVLAARVTPSTLVLLAPFSELPLPWWYRRLLPVLQRIHPGPRPFARVDFTRHDVQAALNGWTPHLDLNDAATQQELRHLRFPYSLLLELERLAQEARLSAALVRCPVLVFQGRDDTTVRPAQTRRFLAAFRAPVWYLEGPGDHQLVRSEHPMFPVVKQLLTDLPVGGNA